MNAITPNQPVATRALVTGLIAMVYPD